MMTIHGAGQRNKMSGQQGSCTSAWFCSNPCKGKGWSSSSHRTTHAHAGMHLTESKLLIHRQGARDRDVCQTLSLCQ